MNNNSKTVITALSGGWLVNLAMYRAALAAGFTVSPIKPMSARDGVHWEATLSLNGKKVIVASNDGNGGPDWVEPVHSKSVQPADARAAADAAGAKLLALPEVHTYRLAFEVEVAKYEKDEALRKTKIESILANNVVPQREEPLGDVIAVLAEVRKAIPKLKKDCAASLQWAPVDAEFGTTMSVKGLLDTPAAREKVMAKWPEKFQGFQGFVSDLLAGL